jgi:hypothetical protein
VRSPCAALKYENVWEKKMGSVLKSIRFVYCNTEENSFDDLGGMEWNDPSKVAAHWEVVPIVPEGSSKFMADLLDSEENIIDNKRVSPDFANLVIERAKSNRLGSIDWVTRECEPEDEY